MDTKIPVIAAVDVGTNSFHLVVGTVNNRGILNIFFREKEMVRLGSSSGDMKYILPEAMERGVRTMSHFRELAQIKDAQFIAVATSAVREALNKDEFLNKVKDATGIDIQVISGVEEARLIYIGALHALPILNRQALVVDIGGGSTETIIGKDGKNVYVNSAKLGAIRLTKAFNLDNTPTKDDIQKCRERIRGEWAPALKRIYETEFDTVVGTSGTIINIALMAVSANHVIIPDVINGITVTGQQIMKVIDKIVSAKNLKERIALPGIDSTRADIILGGALILEYLIETLDIKKIILSSYALREGIVFDYIQKKEAIQEFHHLSQLRYESVISICKQFGVNFPHVEHVKNNSLQLFDDLQTIHKLGYPERELLEAASMLHDVGYNISHDQHHKHSYYIISQCILPGFTNDEAEVIANIARYHRKSLPKKKHENFQKLNKDKQVIVQILAGILRIAEGIDRRQNQIVKIIKTVLNGKSIDIILTPETENVDLDIEIWGANRRKPLLELALDKSINFLVG